MNWAKRRSENASNSVDVGIMRDYFQLDECGEPTTYMDRCGYSESQGGYFICKLCFAQHFRFVTQRIVEERKNTFDLIAWSRS